MVNAGKEVLNVETHSRIAIAGRRVAAL